MSSGHHHWHEREKRSRKSAEASLTTGLIMIAAFGGVWLMTKWFFWIFPLVFAGILPAVEGLRKLMLQRSRSTQGSVGRKSSAEKQILQAAKQENGVITPALVALKTDLSIAEAEKMLEKMAQSGHVLMQVRESGRIEYEFPEFAPRLDH